MKKLPIYIFLLGFFFVDFLYSQSYNDGPIIVDVKLREVKGNFAATDEALLGVGFAPDELTFKIWAQDNLGIYSWTGGSCLQDNNFTPTVSGTPSVDFNNTFANFIYPNALVPQYLDFRIDAWEDDLPSDALNLGPFGNLCGNGQACDWNDMECCGVQITWPIPLCVGIETGDDYRCDANPFYQGLDYRIGPPCQWYSHGYINGSGCVNPSSQPGAPNTDGYYEPHIETYWRYTKGNSFAHAIDLGALPVSPNILQHFNSNECYTDNYNLSTGNDVIYSFNINSPSGVYISLCGINGAQFDSYMYLLSANDTIVSIESNDNDCQLQSRITTSICNSGTYYVVVDAVTANELGTFTLEIREDIGNIFAVNDSLSDYNGFNISCNGGSDGKFYSLVSGGTPPYTYTYSNGTVNVSSNTTDSIVNLFPGTYSVTVTDSKGCSVFIQGPTLTEPNPITITTSVTPPSCYGYNDGLITITNTAGGVPLYNYIWSTIPVQTGANATSLPAGLYTVNITDANGCTYAFQEAVIEPSAPIINITSTNTVVNNNPLTYEVCEGTNITLTASGLSSYSWSPNIWLNTTIGSTITSSPTSPGITYTCTGTDMSGCSVDMSVVIDVVSSVNIYPDIPMPEVCDGEDVTVTFYGASSYSWFPPNYLNTTTGSTVTITPQDTITYTITAIDANGCSDETKYFVDVLSAPNLNLSSSSNAMCYGNSVSLTASGANSYVWTPSTYLNTSIGSVVMASPINTTQYKVIGTGLNGCKDSTFSTVSVNPLPVLNISGTNSICVGDTTTLSVNGANSYVWTPSTTLNSSTGNTVQAYPINTEQYTVIGTDINSCQETTTYTISVFQEPNINIIASEDTICIGDVSILTASGASSYAWSPSATLNTNIGSNVTAAPNTTSIYSVVGTDVNNCSATFSFNVVVNSLPVLSVNPGVSTLCEGDSVLITASGAQDFIWSPALGLNTTLGNQVIAYPNVNTTYQIQGTDINNCTDIISTIVSVNTPPVITLSSNPNTNEICEGGDGVTLTAFGGDLYNWTGPNGFSSTSQTILANPIVAGEYFYTVAGIDANNCQSEATFYLNVGISPEVSISTNSYSICSGESVTLFAEGAQNYLWSPDNTLSSNVGVNVIASPDTTQTYLVFGTDYIGCEGIDSITISVNPLPLAYLNQDTLLICSGDTGAILVEITNGTPPWSINYTINGSLQEELENVSNPLIIPAIIEGEYVVLSIADNNDCNSIGIGAVYVDTITTPIASFYAVPEETDELESEITFVNTTISGDSYSWYFGDTPINGTSTLPNPIYTYDGANIYEVTLTAINGPCIDSYNQEILVKPVYTLYIPNTFTPNGDYLNDYFPWDFGDEDEVLGRHIKEFEMHIYNSWGEVVFSSYDMTNTWNGKMQDNGKIITGIYSYILLIIDDLGVSHTIDGTVLIN